MRPLRSRPASPRRAGITLTEILIAIFIMGVGLISLATLFPLGLLRMQRAMRDSRSTLLARSAIAEVRDRDLLNSRSFGIAGWYQGTVIDPWLSESVSQGADGLISYGYLSPQPPLVTPAVYTNNQLRAGLPVCYDPIWWAILHQNSAGTSHPLSVGLPSRFGNGTQFLRADPDGGTPSAWGLQRITNFRDRRPTGIDGTLFFQANPYPFIYNLDGSMDVASQVFSSPDNIIFTGEDQEVPNRGNTTAPSSLLPDLLTGGGNLMYDLKYTWFFTGYRPNVQESGSYIGSIVVCENRVMGLETVTTPSGGSAVVPQGERVYEAIWGFSGTLVTPLGATGYGYGVGNKTVLIRWYANQPDPVMKSGSYVADVTYERTQGLTTSRFGAPTLYAGQRCEWYRVVGATTPEIDPAMTTHRRMIVTLETPVRAKTLVAVGTGQAAHVNAALVMPSVINVIPQNFVTADGK